MSDISDILDFNPRFRRNRVTDNAPTFRHSILSKSARNSSKKFNSSNGRRGAGSSVAPHVRPIGSSSRRVIIKSRIVKNTSYGKKANELHIKYIEREGVEKDGSQGHLYGADNSFDRDHFLRDVEGEPHQFRFILSPEDGDKMELTEYTRKFMKQVEEDIGIRLEWAAVNHYNTDNPHAHRGGSGCLDSFRRHLRSDCLLLCRLFQLGDISRD